MAATVIAGVGEQISINPNAGTPGQNLFHADIPAGQTWTLEIINEQVHAPTANIGQFVLHCFVTVGGQTLSPWWVYARDETNDPNWWRPEQHPIHLPIVGPASVDFVAVNVDTTPHLLYWVAQFTVAGSVG